MRAFHAVEPFLYVYAEKPSDLLYGSEKRNLAAQRMWISLSQLTDERNVYEQQPGIRTKVQLTASEAGVLCLSYDGWRKS